MSKVFGTSSPYNGQTPNNPKIVSNINDGIADFDAINVRQLTKKISELQVQIDNLGGGGADSTNPVKVKTNVIDFYNDGSSQLIDFFLPANNKGRVFMSRISLELYSNSPEENAIIKIGNNITFDNLFIGNTEIGLPGFFVLNHSYTPGGATSTYFALAEQMIKISINPNTLTSSISGKIYMEAFYENDYIIQS